MAEQRPRFGRVAAGTALVAGVEDAITRDAGARHAHRRAEDAVQPDRCDPITQRLGVQLSCTAITSEVGQSAAGGAVMVGYPYAAGGAVDTAATRSARRAAAPAKGSSRHKSPRWSTRRARRDR